MRDLENNIIVFLLPKDINCFRFLGLWRAAVLRRLLSSLFSGSQNFCIRSCIVSLFLVGNLFEAVEFLTVELVKFGVDILQRLVTVCNVYRGRLQTFDSVFCSRNDNVLAFWDVSILFYRS